ncbi:hypothetical protein KW782_03125 [Candidatus Parcubacteria bacterium]|nr:hypothetical protein [Candidatus Parcubacteria bacterium]
MHARKVFTSLFGILIFVMMGCRAETSSRPIGDFYLDASVDPHTHEEVGSLRHRVVVTKVKDPSGHDITVVTLYVLNEQTRKWTFLGIVSGDSPGIYKGFVAGGLQGVAQATGEVGGAALWGHSLKPSPTNIRVKSEGGQGTATAEGGDGGQGGTGGRSDVRTGPVTVDNSNVARAGAGVTNSGNSRAGAGAKISIGKDGYHHD